MITSGMSEYGCKDPLLIVSASDSSGAAGMQVDIRTAQALSAPVRCVLSAITVQGDAGVIHMEAVPAAIIESSFQTSTNDPPGIGAVKIGMLHGEETVREISKNVALLAAKGIPVVLDPVVRSTSGSPLISQEGTLAIVKEMLGSVTVVTPNAMELEALAIAAGFDGPELEGKAGALIASGAGSVLVTGGEGEGNMCEDILFKKGHTESFVHPRVPGPTPRGTGCALSTAIAAGLAGGLSIDEAVKHGIDFTVDLIIRSGIVGNQRLLFPSGGGK